MAACLMLQNELATDRQMYHSKNKESSTSACKEALAKLEKYFKVKIEKHKYNVTGGYRKYCADLASVMEEYETTEGLGIEVFHFIVYVPINQHWGR